MLLTNLILEGTQVPDLTPLKGMPLANFEIQGTGITDLRPLQGMPLEFIRLTPRTSAKAWISSAT